MSLEQGRLSLQELQANFSDLHPPLDRDQAAVESARCMFCHDAPCIEACPTDIDIPGFIRKITSGNLRGAAITILEQNIMGATCATVCPVEELCEQVCVKNTQEQQPVRIGLLQRHATDFLWASGEQPFERAPDSGKQVAVVGAGPAGLACAHRLARAGHQVTVLEARGKPGGLNEYGLAAYKMIDERAAREAEFILGVGNITLETGVALGKDTTLETLREQYDAVFLGLGHNAVNQLGLDGEQLAGVENAVDFIARIRQEDPQSLPVGRKVVVIGGGNTAIDVAVQVKKLGAETVIMAYRRGTDEMGATDHEQEIAQTHGVLIRNWLSPVALKGEGGRVTGVELEYQAYNGDGRLAGTGERIIEPADQLFKAIGQRFDAAMAGGSEGLELEKGRIRVDESGHTSLPDVWAGGDCTPGRDLTVVAVNEGQQAAESIKRYLAKGGSNG